MLYFCSRPETLCTHLSSIAINTHLDVVYVCATLKFRHSAQLSKISRGNYRSFPLPPSPILIKPHFAEWNFTSDFICLGTRMQDIKPKSTWKETYRARDRDNSSDEKTREKKWCVYTYRRPLRSANLGNGTLTDRSVCHVNETSNYVAHLIFVTKWLVGASVHFSHLTFMFLWIIHISQIANESHVALMLIFAFVL